MATGTIPKTYDPLRAEERWYAFWLERGYFHAPVDPARDPYVIMMPLPNITGALTIAHALNNGIQDLLIRWRRMQGRNAMWMPGTDHASIGTHVVIERELAKEGQTRFDLGRDRFLAYAWDWKGQYGGIIYKQLKRMGFSCDWDRVTFTMDPGYHDAVIEAFLRLYAEGFIYYGKRMINWCPHDLTSVSDLEVEYAEEASTLYHVRYPGADGGKGVVIATQRPETIVADVAVAVHPDDDRYRALVGRQVIVPLVNRPVPVIADRRVDPVFGTGALKITPGHDPLDNEIGADHGLPTLVVLDELGRMTPETGRYAGMDRFDARKAAAEELAALGLIVREEPYVTSIGRCERCKTVLEPYITDQWFMRMKELAAPAIRAVREGRVRFHPERWTNVYLDWMENIRDWNISRRLWWGHHIPVWHCDACGEMVASRDRPARCPNGHGSLRQEEQILDTWFSSGIWPFATLGWPMETPELRYFYPGDVLVTGRDIIFLWVARMIMFGLKFMGGVPFTDVYIHPNVQNLEGKRMSKSLGTGLDPIDYVESLGYGADALRYALVLRSSQTQQDFRFGEKMLDDVRNFNNKIWNIARFVRMNLEGFHPDAFAGTALGPLDRWILSRYQRCLSDATRHLESFEFDKMARTLYEFLWSTFADWYVECAKVDLYDKGATTERREAVQGTLWVVLEGTMRCLHPIMPHLTEEIWQLLPRAPAGEPEPGPPPESIMVSSWPQAPVGWIDEEAEGAVEHMIEVIRAIRSLRVDLGLPPDKAVEPVLLLQSAQAQRALPALGSYIRTLARASRLTMLPPDAPPPARAAAAAVDGVEVFLPVGEAEVDAVRARIDRELAQARLELSRVEARIASKEFIERAPPQVVETERQRAVDLRGRAAALERHRSALR